MKQSLAKKLLPQKYRHKQKRMSKMTYSESEADSNFAINLLSTFAPIFSEPKSDQSESESESHFSLVFMNVDVWFFLTLYLHSK